MNINSFELWIMNKVQKAGRVFFPPIHRPNYVLMSLLQWKKSYSKKCSSLTKPWFIDRITSNISNWVIAYISALKFRRFFYVKLKLKCTFWVARNNSTRICLKILHECESVFECQTTNQLPNSFYTRNMLSEIWVSIAFAIIIKVSQSDYTNSESVVCSSS